MGENKQERFGVGSGVRAGESAGVSGGVRFAAGPGDRNAGVGGGALERSLPLDHGAAERSRPPDVGAEGSRPPDHQADGAVERSRPLGRGAGVAAERSRQPDHGGGGEPERYRPPDDREGEAVERSRPPGHGVGGEADHSRPPHRRQGEAAERSRPPDRGGHPGGEGPAVSLATGVSPATGQARDRDLEARRENTVSSGSGESAVAAASPGESECAEPVSQRRSARQHPGAARSAKRAKPVASRQEERRPAGAVDVAVEDIDTFVVDCDRCAVRGAACADCVVSVLLGPPVGLVWDADERRAVDALAEAGMVPRLRLVPETDSRSA